MGKYDDIINLERPASKKHPRMSMHNRAAQFSPFAALSGHDSAIAETARITGKKIMLTDEEKSIISEKLNVLTEEGVSQYNVRIKYFLPDTRKEGGRYVMKESRIAKIDEIHRTVKLGDGDIIDIENIYDIEGAIFNSVD